MKAFLLALFVGAIAAVEYQHALGGGHAGHITEAACMAPESQQAHVKNTLLQHWQSHR